MNKVLIAAFCLITGSMIASAQATRSTTAAQAIPAGDPEAGRFQFTEETHDFGEIPEGPVAECDFYFKNSGKKPIVIKEAHGSCGCTVPEWPHAPIPPGDKSLIHVKYNSAGRPGPIVKDVIITSDAQQSPMVLHIRGTVKAKPKEVPKPAETATGK